jgi:hypothetical protein
MPGDEPISLTAEKAKRTGNAADWTPRDVLIDCLNRLDGGDISPEGLVICFYEPIKDGGITDVKFSVACPNIIMATGLLHRAVHLLGTPAELA